MSFEAPLFTNAGRALQMRSLDGEPLLFTAIKLGDGSLTSQHIAELTDLINPLVSVPITSASRRDKYFSVKGAFTNQELLTGFYWREIGVYAADPDHPDDRSKDILYCYQNAYNLAEYIASAGSEIVEKVIMINVIVGDVESVIAQIDSSTVFLTQDDLSNILVGYYTKSEANVLLSGKAAANHTHTEYFPTAGGTVSGPLYMEDSHYVHGVITDGTHGGFYDIAEITIKTAWANHSVVFTMSNRGSRPITVVLIFANVATADPEISSLIYYGGSIYNNRVVCYKTGTSTWRLAVHMLDKNDKWTVHDYYRGESKNMMSITWLSGYTSATIPDGAVVATLGGYVQNAERLNTARAIDGVSFDGTADISHYAICSTAAATAAKTVTLAGFALKTGARIAVNFAETNTAANPTLNVNNTGAKAIYYHGKAIVTGYLNAYRLCEFIYNGTQYEYIGDVDTNTDTKVTAVGNHYTPSGGTTTPASGGALTDIANSSAGVQVITGITKDAAGHVTGVTSVALKSTNTVYTLPNAGTGNYGGVKIGSNITVSNGVIGVSAANVAGALGYTPGRLASGTAAATTANCPNGAWYGQYTT